MFVQVFQGQVTDAQQVRQLLDEWVERVAPGADGWLGSTCGVTDDGMFVGTARFESADAAARNSGRAQQGEWWSGLSKLFTGEAVFHDCSEVDVVGRGGSDEAGFVQVMQGRTSDVARMRQMMEQFDQRLGEVRPDLLGILNCLHDGEDGAFTQIAYFVSEEEARAQEAQMEEREDTPPEVAEARSAREELVQDMRYLDLREPWLYSAR